MRAGAREGGKSGREMVRMRRESRGEREKESGMREWRETVAKERG